jgi:iron complex transport system ATP-binding protein
LTYVDHLNLRRGKKILDGLTLGVEPGEIVALVGPNGAGKSTFLRVIAGALKPDSGTVSYDDIPADRMARLTRARFVAYLPQDFTSHWDLTVAELLRLGATRGDGFGWMAALHRTSGLPQALVEDFELAAFLDRRLSTLSGGERARAAIAATVAGQPRLLLADEPVGSLDVAHQLRTMRRFAAMKAQASVLIVMHDINLAGRFADRIAVLHQGRCVLAAPSAEVLASPILDDVFETKFERGRASWGPLLIPS